MDGFFVLMLHPVLGGCQNALGSAVPFVLLKAIGDQAMLAGIDGELDPSAEAQLLEDLADVPLGGGRADDQRVGNLAIGEAAGDQDGNLSFSRCQLGVRHPSSPVREMWP